MKDTIFKQLISTMNPAGTILDTVDVSKLPILHEDARKNKVIWNTLGATAGTTSLTALTVALLHRLNKKKWEKKTESIVKNKVNSLYPITAPNYAEQLSSISDVRNIGLNDLTKEAAYDPSSGRGLWNYGVDAIKDTIWAGLPIAGAITGAVIAPTLINKILAKKEEKALDDQILERRNKLAALQAKYIELGMQKNNSASSYEGLSPYSIMLGILGASTTSLLGLAIYKYMNKTDANRKTLKVLENVMAENSTNIPQRISLKLNAEGRPARDKEDQTYIKDMNKAIASATTPENADFDDKITKVEKDALFS